MKKAICLLNNESGLSLIELIVTMLIVVIVLTMNTSTLGVALKQAKQQMQASGAQMDKIAGLEILRMDVESAGYGLPWSFKNAINYSEAAGTTPATYNDSPSGAPHAVMTGNGSGLNSSDYLVIKSTSVGTSATARKWNYISYGNTKVGSTAVTYSTADSFAANERVTVIWANASGGLDKQLIMDGSSYYTTMADGVGTISTNFRPVTASQSYVVYGIDPSTNLRMPFNRADYYIAQPAMQGCAAGTGVLYKGTVSHADGTLTATPLLDCVADIQVAFGLDTNGDNVVDAYTNSISALDAPNVRTQVREVRIYILSHEGVLDKAFNYVNNNATTIRVGDSGLGLGRDFDFAATVGTGWRNYRWKLDTLVVRPKNIFG